MDYSNMERVKHIFGNVLRLGIPLTKRVVTVENGETSCTDEDFIPTGAVTVELSSGVRTGTVRYRATMDGNVAMFTDNGTLPVGVYAVSVLCKDENGSPYRFKERAVIHVYEYTADADIKQPVDFNSKVWYLDAAIYLVPTSPGGGGISNETDPVFSASPAAGITSSDIQRWNQQGGGGQFVQEQSDWDEADTTNPAYIKNKPTIPVIPTDVSSFNNDAGYLTQHQDISGKANSADLATVATSGSYNDLKDKPNIPAGVTVDSTITQNGTNPVQGGAIYSALYDASKQQTFLTFTATYDGDDIASGTFTDVDNNTLTDSQVRALLADANKDIVIKYAGHLYKCDSIDLGGSAIFSYYQYFNRRVYTLEIGLDEETLYYIRTDTQLVPQTRTVNGKALSSNITLNASDVGAQSTIADLATIRSGAAAGATALQPADVSVETPATPDGTFELNVGSNTYTVNLNHEHPEYAPLVHTHSQYALVQVVNGESSLPATLDPKTIYGVKADGVDELEMVVIGGYKFYGGGGGAPGQPVLMQPAAGSTISMGTVDNGYGGSTLDPKSKSVNIKARNITQPISISVSGTGFSIENSVSQISAADAIAGTTINVLFDGSSGSQGGTLLLQSTDFGQVPLSVDLAVDYVTYEALGAVGLRGSQWIQTDYIANPNTNIKLVTKFTPNSNTRQTGTIGCVFDSRKNGTRVVSAYFGGNSAENNAGTYLLNLATDGGVVKGSYYQQMKFFTAANTPDNSFCNKGTLNYSGTSASFNNKSITIVRQTTTADHGMTIGINDVADAAPMNAFDVDIYSLEITESGTTVRNYIPLKKSGVPGLYDTVHGTFHSSETDTPLAEVATT